MSPFRRKTPDRAAVALKQLTEAVDTYRAETERIARELAMAACRCVEAGATWREVGERLGISKQAARAHWAPFLEEFRRSSRNDLVPEPGTESPAEAGVPGSGAPGNDGQ
jgi:hypothetical protein